RYDNTEGDFHDLGCCSRYARYLGLLRAEDLDDRRNPDPTINYPPADALEPRCEMQPVPDWTLPRIDSDLAQSRRAGAPGVEADSGCDSRPCDQPYLLELWIEKSTMNDILEPLCRELGVNLVCGVGFQSITGVIRLLQRVVALQGMLNGRPCRVF